MTLRCKLKIEARRPRKGEVKVIDSDEAFHFSVGSVLGDGSIHKRDFNLAIEQKSPTYTWWKRKLCVKYGLVVERPGTSHAQPYLFGGIEANFPFAIKRHRKLERDTGKLKFNRSYSFATRALYHDRWRSLFYEPYPTKKGKVEFRKRIPENIKDYFWGDLALAIFFLDDGWYDWDRHTVRFSAGEWPRNECELLKDCLQVNFNLRTEVYPLTGDVHHIYVFPDSYPEFRRRVSPFIDEFLAAFPKYPVSVAMKNKVLV